MKKNTASVFTLALISLVDGYLLSGISFVGRAGISVAYKEYQFLKSWWKAALLVFVVWLVLYIIQFALKQKVNKRTSDLLQIAFLIIATVGLYVSYSDFHNSLSHRWLGTRFHLGVYVFWLGSIAISLFILLGKRKLAPASDMEGNRITSGMYNGGDT